MGLSNAEIVPLHKKAIFIIVNINIISACITNNIMIFSLVKVDDELSNECTYGPFSQPFQKKESSFSS